MMTEWARFVLKAKKGKESYWFFFNLFNICFCCRKRSFFCLFVCFAFLDKDLLVASYLHVLNQEFYPNIFPVSVCGEHEWWGFGDVGSGVVCMCDKSQAPLEGQQRINQATYIWSQGFLSRSYECESHCECEYPSVLLWSLLHSGFAYVTCLLFAYVPFQTFVWLSWVLTFFKIHSWFVDFFLW